MNNKFLSGLICLSIIILSFSCASHTKTNREVKKLDCEKPFYFMFDKQSNSVKIEKIGDNIGESKLPSYELSFIEALNDLSQDLNTDLKYTKERNFPNDSIVFVRLRIEKIVWNFRFADAIMETDLLFKLPHREIRITGDNTVYAFATKKGNLTKSLKNGIYKFLLNYCSDPNNMFVR